ncbi:MAG: hypothetical protein FJX15_13120 [Alphaproteobacteria bacterium]|nr:hypothetical protein [Alphaproteobacteria bacterium]
MTPATARADLDGFLRDFGQDCVLQRIPTPGAAPISVNIRAHIVDFKPDELLGGNGLQTGDSHAIMSATEVEAEGWPTLAESRIPRKGDRLVVAGRTRTVLYGWAAPYINGELVRIELAIKGTSQ